MNFCNKLLNLCLNINKQSNFYKIIGEIFLFFHLKPCFGNVVKKFNNIILEIN